VTDLDPIAALAGQLEQLRGELSRYGGEVGQLKARHAEDYGRVIVLLSAVKQLTEKIDAAMARRETDDPAAPYWIGLPEDERAAQLGELREWVEHVARVQWPAYLAHLPPCWPAHGEAVWELGNLMTEWRRIYSDVDNRPLPDALMYFDRWLPGALGRLERALKCDVSGCRLAKPPQPWERSPPRYT
jgi:hypothetical protein